MDTVIKFYLIASCFIIIIYFYFSSSNGLKLTWTSLTISWSQEGSLEGVGIYMYGFLYYLGLSEFKPT